MRSARLDLKSDVSDLSFYKEHNSDKPSCYGASTSIAPDLIGCIHHTPTTVIPAKRSASREPVVPVLMWRMMFCWKTSRLFVCTGS